MTPGPKTCTRGQQTDADEAVPDRGLTLVELVVALGVFSVLLVLITSLVVQATRAVHSTASDANVQQQQQNAILWFARLLRYADNPVEASPMPSAIVTASAAELSFYSFTGTGGTDRVPYLITLKICPAGLTTCQEGDIISEIRSPDLLHGKLANSSNPTFGDARIRSLVRAEQGRTPALTLTYLDEAGKDMLAADPTGSVPSESQADISAVRVLITDPGSGLFADQTVTLVNPR